MKNTNTVYLEGSLFLADQLAKMQEGNALRQTPDDYGITRGFPIQEEWTYTFRQACLLWKNHMAQDDPISGSIRPDGRSVRQFVGKFLERALGYTVESAAPVTLGETTWHISMRANGLPVFLGSAAETLDRVQENVHVTLDNGNTRNKSPFAAAQEYLNASQADLWGIVTNGKTIRLLRDNMSLTRPAWLEFDLEAILSAEDYAAFVSCYRILHASRTRQTGDKTVWEQWIEEGAQTGNRIRDGLRRNVTEALLCLGEGFLKVPDNTQLREKIGNNTLSAEAYLHELLRLMYRFIFLFCLEERQLLHTPEKPVTDGLADTEKADRQEENETIRQAKARYAESYAMHLFREKATLQRYRNSYTDAWDGVRIVMRSLARGEKRLALPALGGLFAEDQCPELDKCWLDNAHFYEAMHKLRWTEQDNVRIPIDYKNMDSEELGSVYESLLELVPVVDAEQRTFAFSGEIAGSERKSSGSYYTPDMLVQHLLKTALDPVIESRLAETTDAEAALLGIRVIDPACGSGHFLLAAARRIAERLARYRTDAMQDGIITQDVWRKALRDVIRYCIHGVDINPLAIELAKTALWLEGHEPGRPLSFLDHHLKVGNSLFGVINAAQLEKGISDTAYGVHPGDDRTVCSQLKKNNREQRKSWQKFREEHTLQLAFDNPVVRQLDAMESDTLTDEQEKARRYEEGRREMEDKPLMHACNLLIAAFLCRKTAGNENGIPTTQDIYFQLCDDPDVPVMETKRELARKLCAEHAVFHWCAEFADIMNAGGFDCVLGNPPWEKPKVKDKKWFANRKSCIANAPTAAVRRSMINDLSQGLLDEKQTGIPATGAARRAEQDLYRQYENAVRLSDVFSAYMHMTEDEGGRYPLTGVGDTNLYACFAELARQLKKRDGRAGLVLPTGIVTDDTAKVFAQKIIGEGELVSLYDFENREQIFPIDSRYRFCMMTLGQAEQADMVFYATRMAHLDDERRHSWLTPEDVRRMNPNTRTAVIMRSAADTAINRGIYTRVPVFIREGGAESNPWRVEFLSMLHMANDSKLFHGGSNQSPSADSDVPLLEGKLIHQFDCRFASFDGTNKKGEPDTVEVTDDVKENPDYAIRPRYWIDPDEVKDRLLGGIRNTQTGEKIYGVRDAKKGWRVFGKGWEKPWMLGFRDIASATNERTVIATVLPATVACGNKLPLILPDVTDREAACLLANLNSLVLDYCDRLKQSGANVSLFILKQLPVLPPDAYTDADRDFIVSRVAALTRNCTAINEVWLRDYPAVPWQGEEARLAIRCELDAYYARLYRLTRDELRFILDPEAVYGPDYPSVTFPGLKKSEMARYGEYRTERLVLEAWDRLASGDLR